jgi:Arc/MetJ-type ribon-helix-helix transcriptional regulator
MNALPEEPGDVSSASLVSHLRELATLRDGGEASPEWRRLLERFDALLMTPLGNLRSLGPARKVSVSLPEGLTAVVQQRVGKGEFSHYVAEAVARQLELDLLAELTALLDAEHGPVPEDLLAEAGAAWPDVE